MQRGDSIAYGLNLLMLLFVTLLPFTTRLMVTRMSGPEASIAVIIYGLNVLAASLARSLLMFYVDRQPRLLGDELADFRSVIPLAWMIGGVRILPRAVKG